jgi:hypothetical protein
MKVKHLVYNLLGIDPEMEVYVHLPEKEDDFQVSDVTVIDDRDDADDYVRLSFAV